MSGRTRVLQVDDEESFLEMSATLLERTAEDIDVVTADGGEAALECLADGAVDCVVSDYDMPGMDGLELLRAVRERYPGMPFILLTARGSEAVASEAISAGVDDYLQKGGGDEQYQLLANRVRNLVRQSRAEQSYREIFENATVGLTVRDTETGELIDANERYCDLLGYTLEELLEVDFEAISVVEEGFTEERALEHVRSVDEDEFRTFEWLYRTSDGERLWVEASLRLAEIEGEQRVLSSARDITERKSHEEDLAETREYYETVAANLPRAAVGIYDEDLVYDFVDGGIFEEVSVDTDDLEGGAVGAVHTDGFVEDHREDYRAAFDGGTRAFEFEFEGRSFRAHTVPVTDEDGGVIAGMIVAHDVTSERQRQRRLEGVANLLAHDLRDPLAVADDAVANAAAGDPDSLDAASDALDRIRDTIDDALAMTETDDVASTLPAVDLARVARCAWRTVETGDATLTVEGTGHVRTFDGGLHRLLEDLFADAVRRGHAETVVVEGIDGGFAVTDDGEGTPENRAATVVGEGGSTDAVGPGGDGLASADRVATALDWSVAVEASDRGGTRIEVTGVENDD